MNNTITADMLRLNTDISLMESLTIIFLYVFFAIYISRWSYKQSKKYNLVSLESFRFTKRMLASYKNNATTKDILDLIEYVKTKVKEKTGNYVWMCADEINADAALPTAFRQFWEEISHV